jgi:hypothetical protein
MGDTNPNIQRVSFEEIQEFKDLDLFNLPGNRLMGDKFLPLDHRLLVLLMLRADGGNKTFLCSMATLQL